MPTDGFVVRKALSGGGGEYGSYWSSSTAGKFCYFILFLFWVLSSISLSLLLLFTFSRVILTPPGSFVEFGAGGMSQYCDCDPMSLEFGNITEIDDINPYFETRVEAKGKQYCN